MSSMHRNRYVRSNTGQWTFFGNGWPMTLSMSRFSDRVFIMFTSFVVE